MAAYKFTSHRQLKDALNNIENCQKKNIDEYSWGHLNEKNLPKASSIVKEGKCIWKSSKKKKKPLKDSDLVPELKSPGFGKSKGKQHEMNDVLYQFSLGINSGAPEPPPMFPNDEPGDPIGEQVQSKTDLSGATKESTKVRKHSAGSMKSVYSLIDDGILVEELPNQEMMVRSPRLSKSVYTPKRFQPLDDTGLSDAMTELTQTLDADGYLTMKHTFLPSFKSGITKSDQFNKLRRFEDRVLKIPETREQNVLSGYKAVDHLEKRLAADLVSMNLGGAGPNFHKLQVFSNNFEDLIEETPTFGYMLKCIKVEYDNYITKLLDSQTPAHSQLLRDQVQQMSTRGTSRPQELGEAKRRVADLEDEARARIAENESLREQVREAEEWLANAPEPGSKRNRQRREPPTIPVTSIFVDDTPVELADEIEHDKALILEKLDALNDLRRKLRLEYVPLTVCTHLEQCIKETEIEVQKLLKQNEYFEGSNNEMETELKDSIQDADTSERDARRIWKKVNSLKGMPRVNSSYKNGAQEDSDDEQDDETKWNWYIS